MEKQHFSGKWAGETAARYAALTGDFRCVMVFLENFRVQEQRGTKGNAHEENPGCMLCHAADRSSAAALNL
jgi:hypothetical protein